jgi:hypothetical protein
MLKILEIMAQDENVISSKASKEITKSVIDRNYDYSIFDEKKEKKEYPELIPLPSAKFFFYKN